MISHSTLNKKEEILNAALKLFVEFGFHATPTSRIAKEAGVANGTLFHYFKTKEELILELYLQTKAELTGFTYLTVNQQDIFKVVLKTVFIKTIEWAQENKTKYHFLQQFSASPFYTVIPSEKINEHKQPLIAILETGIKTNALKQLPVDLLYSLVTNHIEGVSRYLSSKNVSDNEQQEMINEAFDLLGV